jgi:hypothetical protein
MKTLKINSGDSLQERKYTGIDRTPKNTLSVLK